SGVATVTGAGNVFTITLGGNLAGFDQPKIVAAISTGPGTASVNTATDGAGGTVVANAAQLQIAGSITVAGEPLILQGTGTVLEPEVQRLTLTGTTAGSFALTFPGPGANTTTVPLPFGASAAQVKAALQALSSVGGVGGVIDVYQSAPGTYDFIFRGSFTATNQPALSVATVGGSPEVQNLSITAATPGTTQFTLTFN